MKKVLVGAMALLTLAACSNEEVLQKNEVNQEIGFTAVTGKALTRAADGYCNNAKPESFNVWASAQGKNYFANEAFKKYTESGTDVWKPSDGTVRYWPESGTVDFYATKNENGTPTWTYTTPTSLKFVGYTVNDNVTAQTDFIYAASLNTPKGSGTATLNFRHALSQIEFKAKNENSKIYIEIDEVKLVNVYKTGDITISKDTNTPYVEHSPDDVADTDTRVNVCDWNNQSGTATYSVSFHAVTFDDITTKSLTVTDPSDQEYNANTMYILPQEHAVWNKSTAAKASGQTGSYFIVKALIYNKVGSNVDKTNDVVVWGDYDALSSSWKTKEIAIPVPTSTVWKDGMRYVYTFVFTTTGTGGYDPGTNDPVLTPIKLSVTVDDFVDAGKTDVTM